MQRAKDIEAIITFMLAEHGGRSGPTFSEYRPQFFYSGRDWDAVHTYPEVERVMPGDTVRAFLTFLSPAEHLGKVYPGMPFLVREGARTVAYGSVVRIIELEKSAERAQNAS